MDTAESIGYSCGIFSEDSDVYKIRETNDVKKVIKVMKQISKKIDEIDSELIKITQMHHEDMIENKIIQNDEKYKKYRHRFNSFNYGESKDNFDLIILNKKKIENNKIDIIEIKDNEESIPNSPTKITNNNEKNNRSKMKTKEEGIDFDEIPLNKNRNNISMEGKIIQFNDDLDKLTNSSKNSKNDKIIFKFVAKNVDNISNYSIVQKEVKNVADSVNSSEIFNENTNLPKKEIVDSKGKMFVETNQKDDTKNIREYKKSKDIPLEEKKFKAYFDNCQKELIKMAIKQSNWLKLFKNK